MSSTWRSPTRPLGLLLLFTAAVAVALAPSRGALFALISVLSLLSIGGLDHLSRRGSNQELLVSGWSVLVSAHIVLGMGAGLYDSSPIYDKCIHLFAFMWVARCLPVELRRRFPAMAVLAAVGVGAGWELFEFCTDQGGWFIAQKGLEDTMIDLFCDSVGAVLGVFAPPGRAASAAALDAPNPL